MSPVVQEILQGHYAAEIARMACACHAKLDERGYPGTERKVTVEFSAMSADNPLICTREVTVSHVSGGSYTTRETACYTDVSLWSVDASARYADLTKNTAAIEAIAEAIADEKIDRVMSLMWSGKLYMQDESGHFCKV